MKHPEEMNSSGAQFLYYCEQAGFKKLPVDDWHVVALETLLLMTHDRQFTCYREPWVVLV